MANKQSTAVGELSWRLTIPATDPGRAPEVDGAIARPWPELGA